MERERRMQDREELTLKKLSGAECRLLRPLWEETFGGEESPAFTELYFKERAAGNRGYGLYLGKRPVSMLYLTPYPVNLRERAEVCPHILYYIVGVATAEDCRHRGYMTRLLREALKDMRREGLPFTYLTPASPAIYEPFDFRYIGQKPVWEFSGACPPFGNGTAGTALSFWRRLGREDFGLLARRAEGWLALHNRISIRRDAAYYTARAAELEAEGGGVYGWFPQGDAMRGGIFQGAALLLGNWRQEPEEGIVEAYAWEDAENFPFRERGLRPSVMGRMLDAEALLSLCVQTLKAETVNAGTEKAETEKAETVNAGTEKAETEKAETVNAGTEKAETEKAKTVNVNAGIADTEAEQTEPEQTESLQTEPEQTEPVQIGTGRQKAAAPAESADSGKKAGGSCRLWLEDPFLPENTGAYEWLTGATGSAEAAGNAGEAEAGRAESSVRRLPDAPKEACSLCLTAAELTEIVFGQKEAPSALVGLRPFTGVFLNEIV